MITEQEALAALPSRGFLRDYVLAVKETTDAPVAFHIPMAALCLAQTTPRDLGYPIGAMKIRTHLYTLLIGKSTSSRKTHCISHARELLRLAKVGHVAETPGSHEGLIEGLRESPRQVIFYGEFGEFLSQSASGYLNAVRMSYTSIYDGAEPGRALAKRFRRPGSVPLTNAQLSLGCGSTLSFLEEYTKIVDWEGGFLGRFFTIAAERERNNPLPPPRMPGLDALVARLAALQDLGQHYEANYGNMPECLGLDQQATACWLKWHAALTAHADTSPAEVEAAISRAQGMAQKLAVLIAWDMGLVQDSGPDGWYITPEVLEPALAITDLHIRSVVEIGHRIAPDRNTRDTERVLRLIKSRAPRPVKLDEILRDGPKLPGFVKYRSDILDFLKASGVIKAESDGKTTVYTLANPTPAAPNGPDARVIPFRRGAELPPTTALEPEAAPPLTDGDDEPSSGSPPTLLTD